MMLHATILAVPLLPVALVCVIWLWTKREWQASRLILLIIFFVYLYGVLQVAFFPLPVADGRSAAFGSRPQLLELIRLVPNLGELSNWSGRQLYGNVALGVPFGILVPLSWPVTPRRVIALGAWFALGIEAMQFAVSWAIGWPYRTVDANDFLLNWLGVILGLLALQLVKALAKALLYPEGAPTGKHYIAERLVG